MLSASGDKTNGSRIILQGANQCSGDIFLAGAFRFFSFRPHLHHGCAVALDPGFAGQLWFLIHIYEVDMNSARELGIQVQLIFGPLEAGALVKISDLGVLF